VADFPAPCGGWSSRRLRPTSRRSSRVCRRARLGRPDALSRLLPRGPSLTGSGGPERRGRAFSGMTTSLGEPSTGLRLLAVFAHLDDESCGPGALWPDMLTTGCAPPSSAQPRESAGSAPTSGVRTTSQSAGISSVSFVSSHSPHSTHRYDGPLGSSSARAYPRRYGGCQPAWPSFWRRKIDLQEPGCETWDRSKDLLRSATCRAHGPSEAPGANHSGGSRRYAGGVAWQAQKMRQP